MKMQLITFIALVGICISDSGPRCPKVNAAESIDEGVYRAAEDIVRMSNALRNGDNYCTPTELRRLEATSLSNFSAGMAQGLSAGKLITIPPGSKQLDIAETCAIYLLAHPERRLEGRAVVIMDALIESYGTGR